MSSTVPAGRLAGRHARGWDNYLIGRQALRVWSPELSSKCLQVSRERHCRKVPVLHCCAHASVPGGLPPDPLNPMGLHAEVSILRKNLSMSKDFQATIAVI